VNDYIATPDGTYLLDFWTDKVGGRSVSYDRLVEGVAEDCPEMVDVCSEEALVAVVERLGLPHEEAVREAVARWGKAWDWSQQSG